MESLGRRMQRHQSPQSGFVSQPNPSRRGVRTSNVVLLYRADVVLVEEEKTKSDKNEAQARKRANKKDAEAAEAEGYDECKQQLVPWLVSFVHDHS
jgi:hypothetical protein